MSTIADKLQELINSKADMKSAIAEKGVEVEGGLTTYAAAIRKIQQGSGGGTDIDWSGVRFGGSTKIPLAPNELYKCGNMDRMFEGCDLWTLAQNFDFNSLDTSFASSFECTFQSAYASLLELDHLNTSNVTNFRRVLKDSVFIEMDGHIPNWDTHNGVNFYEAFASSDINTHLTHIPQWDFSNAVNIQGLVSGLFGLVSIPKLNFSKIKSDNMFDFPLYNQPEAGSSGISSHNLQYLNLTDLGGFTGLKFSYFSLDMCPNLTVESIMNVINEMYNWNVNPDNLNILDWQPGTSNNTATLRFGTTNLNKLTDEQIAVATAKGWTLI